MKRLQGRPGAVGADLSAPTRSTLTVRKWGARKDDSTRPLWMAIELRVRVETPTLSLGFLVQ